MGKLSPRNPINKAQRLGSLSQPLPGLSVALESLDEAQAAESLASFLNTAYFSHSIHSSSLLPDARLK